MFCCVQRGRSHLWQPTSLPQLITNSVSENNVFVAIALLALDFDIGHVDATATFAEMGIEQPIEVQGNIVVGNGSPSHGEDFTINLFISQFLLGFPDEIFIRGHSRGLLQLGDHGGRR